MWYFALYDGISPQNRKDIKLYNVRKLMEEYVLEHGKEFLKSKRDKVSKTSGCQSLIGSVLGTGVQGVCYFFLTLMAVGGSVAVVGRNGSGKTTMIVECSYPAVLDPIAEFEVYSAFNKDVSGLYHSLWMAQAQYYKKES